MIQRRFLKLYIGCSIGEILGSICDAFKAIGRGDGTARICRQTGAEVLAKTK